MRRARTGRAAGQRHDRRMTGGSGPRRRSGRNTPAPAAETSPQALLGAEAVRRPGLVAATDPYAPESVAVYRLFNFDGALLYVGISDNPKRRFAQHARDKGWWYLAVRWEVEWYQDRNAALAEEARAIREEVPAYNLDGVLDELEVDQAHRWVARLRERRPSARDLDALFLDMVRARSFSLHLWPSPHRRRWHPDKVHDVYLAARDAAAPWSIWWHRQFIEVWNGLQEEASVRMHESDVG